MKNSKKDQRQKRRWHIRKKVTGTALRPRLAVFRSNNNIYAQLIDDVAAVTLASASSQEKDFAGNGGNVAAAATVGKLIGERAVSKEIKTVIFDRGGFKFHGRIKALADSAREAGLQF